MADLAREFRAGYGDAGICFELAVHDALVRKSELVYLLAADALKRFCRIDGEPASLLFGPEKQGRIPVLESVRDALTDDSRLYSGSRGTRPLLKQWMPQLVRAFRKADERERLPRTMSGLWKADLFLGTASSEMWVGTTVKIKGSALEAARGLRIGIYPKQNDRDVPRLDAGLNLIRLSLPYDGEFVELFWKAFWLVGAFLHADARLPEPVRLPDSEDRMICEQLVARRLLPVLEVTQALRAIGQTDLLSETNRVTAERANAVVSEPEEEVTREPEAIAAAEGDFTSLAPVASATESGSEPDQGQISWLPGAEPGRSTEERAKRGDP